MIAQYHFARAPAVPLADVSVEPALPVAVAERSSSGSDRELVRNEVVVCHDVCCEVRQISEAEGAHSLCFCIAVDLEPDIPRMTVPAGSSIFFRDAGVGGDVAVKKIVRKRADQLGDP